MKTKSQQIKKAIQEMQNVNIESVGIIQEDVFRVCELLEYLMKNKQQMKVYTILKEFKAKVPDGDITYFLDQLLPYGDLLFYRYVKGECHDMMNSYHTFDKILHTMDPKMVINLLKFDIIEPEYSAKINEKTLEEVLYMIIQFNEYQDELISYILETYSSQTSYSGLAHHMLFYNVTNDILVYLKAIKDKQLLCLEYIDFQRVWNSFEHIQKNNLNSILTRSRMINVIDLFVNICKKEELMMPEYINFYNHFTNLYKLSGDTEKLENSLERLCKDCYDHINGKLPWGLQS